MSAPSIPPSSSTAEQLVQQRREKKDRLASQGKTPYGRRFERTLTLGAAREAYDPKLPKDAGPQEPLADQLHLAGRLMTRRDLGKLCFAHLQDHTGQLQIKITQQDVTPEVYKEFLKDVDLGDILGVAGRIGRTKTGELTLSVQSYEILSKSLRPWPEKYHGVTDIETRTRQRELDLATNAESKQRFIVRSRIIDSVRRTLGDLGFDEVETPIMQAVPGGAAAKPFITHHEALDLQLYMRIAPELYLKRLLVGGFERVYEIGRAFRNEGIDTRHNPEFTILEAYQAYADVRDMMDLAEKIIQNAAKKVGVTDIDYRGEKCSVADAFERLSLTDLFKKHLDLDYLSLCRGGGWADAARAKGLRVADDATDRKCFDLLFDERILTRLDQPTFVLDYPAAFSPLAKTKPGQPLLADRFELFIGKEEVANAYTEQNDPDEQRRRFGEEVAKRQGGDEEAMPSDDEFILALEHGMPPAGGLGIGIDRLTMILTGSASIREVILFPLLKPQ